MRWKPILVLENLPVGIVSILILMDNALEVLKEQVGFEKDLCFNPYSNGQCAGRIITVFTDDDQNCVSILVMLDNALEAVDSRNHILMNVLY